MDTEHALIRRIWSTELEILKVVDEICKKNNLTYTLAFGTLLGAVRHQGFIPWDDDVDIMMPRKDYETLLRIWHDEAPAGYVLQDYHTSPDYTNNFAKIRKDHTTFLQFEYEREKTYHKGVFIDIFPGDHVAPSKLGRCIQFAASAVNLLYSRGYPSGAGGIMGFAERILLSVKKSSYSKIRLWAEGVMRRWNHGVCAGYVFPCTIAWCRHYYAPDLFANPVPVSFCDHEFPAPRDYDKVLTSDYGDYMKLPPEEDRIWTHHPILIDFDRNYEDIS